MSTTPRPPLLSDDIKNLERIAWRECATLRKGPKDPYGPMMESWNRGGFVRGIKYAKDIYEAARAKDAELIQRLVDAMSALLTNSASKKVGEEDLWALAVLDCRRAKNAAAAAGFTPTEP